MGAREGVLSIFFLILISSHLVLVVAEIFTRYDYRLKDCENENLYKCDYRRQRICTQGPGTPEFLCSRGTFYEEFHSCSNYELANNFCAGGYEYEDVVQDCSGVCQNNHEKVKFKCKSNPDCSKIAHLRCTCNGIIREWSSWSNYGFCSKTCNTGTKQRTRYKCYDQITNEISTDCGTDIGRYIETSSTHCNTFPCDWFIKETTAVSTTKPKPTEKATTTKDSGARVAPSVCTLSCQATLPSDISQLIKNCDDDEICNRDQTYAINCDKSLQCTESKSDCEVFEEWSDWTVREPNSEGVTQRARHRICKAARAEDSSCQQEVTVEYQCTDVNGSTFAPTTDTGVPWLLPFIICLVVVLLLVCFCGVWCYLMGRRHYKRKEKTSEVMQNSVNANNPDDVFVTSGAQPTATPQGRKDVMDRIGRISEHVYEAINGGARLFSRASTSEDGLRGGRRSKRSAQQQPFLSPNKVENEYVGDEGPPPGNGNVVFRRDNRGDKNLRVSVLVTDPDGVEVFSESQEDAAAAYNLLDANKTGSTEYVEMNSDDQSSFHGSPKKSPGATQKKKQWDRLPSPPSRGPSPQPFFPPSHGHGSRPVSAVKAGIMSMLQDPEQRSSQNYDIPTNDSHWPEYIPPAPPSATDTVSMWSDSSFESTAMSDVEYPEEVKKSAKGKKGRKSTGPEHYSTPSNLPSPKAAKPDYLIPNSKRVESVQYLAPRPGNPMLGGALATSAPSLTRLSTEQRGTYLNMSKDRATVKSWMNLGEAPRPDSDGSGSSVNGYCAPNQLPHIQHDIRLKREQSLDEKYTVSPVRRSLGQDLNNPHINEDGYFEVVEVGKGGEKPAPKAPRNGVKLPLMPPR